MRSDLAVLFDLDGVIVDSRPYHLAAWHQFARDESIEHTPDYFTQMFGLRNDAIIGGLVADLPPERLAELAARKEQLFRDAARGHLEPLPGVRELLDALDARAVPRAIVTSTPRANLEMILETLASPRFQALVAEEDASRGKPDPEGFLVAARRLDVAAEICVVIEDAPAGLARREGRRHACHRHDYDAPCRRPRRRRPRRRRVDRARGTGVHPRLIVDNP